MLIATTKGMFLVRDSTHNIYFVRVVEKWGEKITKKCVFYFRYYKSEAWYLNLLAIFDGKP